MVRPQLDSKISLGNILTIVGMLGTFIVFWAAFASRVTATEVRVRNIELNGASSEERIEKRLERIEDKIDKILK